MTGGERTPAAKARARIRAGLWTRPTANLAPGYIQASLAVVSAHLADDFESFCRANPRALPLLDRTDPGSPVPKKLAPSADLRTDLPVYRVYRHGKLDEEATDIVTLWHADSVAFLLGCSLTFDAPLAAGGTPVRHLEAGGNVPMYITDRATKPAGAFSGPLVVSMRPIRERDVPQVIAATRQFGFAHGEPIHIARPLDLGIDDLDSPDFGERVPIEPGEIPVFWASGVTALAAAIHSRTPRMITHAPGHMFITDLTAEELASRDTEPGYADPTWPA